MRPAALRAARLLGCICTFTLVFVSVPALRAQNGQASASAAAVPNYDLAAQWTTQKVNRLVFDTSVTPRWLETGDRFWYSYQTREGRRFYLVDPVKKTKAPLFDPAKMAAQLTLITRIKGVVGALLVAVAAVAGQQFPVGTIDFYGLGDLREQDALGALTVKAGDVVSFEGERPGFIAASERGLAALPGVRAGHVHVVCCEEGKVTVYVGIERKGAQSFVFLPAPKGSVRLPADVVQAGEAFDDAITAAVGRGDATEDDSQGHALFHDPAARAVQERFVGFAARDLALLRQVLRESSDAGHRALAAQVIAYTARKDDVINDLARAMRDPSENVRNDAMRALAVFAAAAPAARPKRAIPLDGFVGLLNSPVWTDRNKASLALLRLTESRDPALLARLRREALASLVDMARWKSAGHAALGATILGRMAGLSEEKIAAATETLEGRETIVAAVMAR